MSDDIKRWHHIGIAHVDAGMLLIGDPCYSAYDNHPDHPIHNWGALVDALDKPEHARGMQLNHKAGHAGCGVIVHTGGDGQFTVDARFNKYGGVIEIRIMRDQA